MPPNVKAPTDFFSTNVAGSSFSSSSHSESTDSFARAIETRFDSGPVSLFTARLLNPPTSRPKINSPNLLSRPPTSTPSSSPISSSSPARPHPSTSNSASSNFSPLLPANLDSFINDPGCLILDIRPNTAFSSAHLPRAVSLSVPSTLLKRPLFSLEKLSQMLSSKSARSRFLEWSKASTILVYDADSQTLTDSSNISGLLRKFRNEGFPLDRQLIWLKGGFVSVWRERSDLVVSGPDPIDEDDDEDESDNVGQLMLSPAICNSPVILRTRNLPMSAFLMTSTTAQRPSSSGSHHPPQISAVPSSSRTSHHHPITTLPPPPDAPPTPTKPAHTEQSLTVAFNPFYDAVRQNLELSQGISERIPLTLPANVRERLHELPFPWLRHIARRAAPAESNYTPPPTSPGLESFRSSSPSSNSCLSDRDKPTPANPPKPEELIEEGTESLAMQFYRIELGEQRRLMGIMQHHSQESGHVLESSPTPESEESDEKTAMQKAKEQRAKEAKIRAKAQKASKAARDALFPYSITAGVEKGAKNRYRNIWPFEHARVRLHQHTSSDDDYINASFVQPLGTNKRYIATQGPLEATLSDFWTLVWEQNVHVIVMLTKEVEGMHVKSANYWGSAQHGPLILSLVESTETKEQEERRISREGWSWGGYPALASPSSSPRPPTVTIKRRLELRNTDYPQAGVRRIVQLQYLEWPDLNVPDDPRGILDLVRDVNNEIEDGLSDGYIVPKAHSDSLDSDGLDKSTGIMKQATEHPPLLLHCSAGVGRTGGFIAVDAVLDGVRKEIRKRRDNRKKRRGVNFCSVEDNDVVMIEEQNGASMQVDGDDNKKRVLSPTPGGSLVMPIHGGGGNRDLVVHVPVVGWSHGKPDSSSSSEDVSRKGSPDPDQPSRMDVDSHKLQQKRRQGLGQTSPWVSTRAELMEWPGSGMVLQPDGIREDWERSSSSGRSSGDDGGLASRSGSGSGSIFGSGGSSQVQDKIHVSNHDSVTGPSSSTFPISSSPSTRSSSIAPENKPEDVGSRSGSSSAPSARGSLAASPPRSTTAASSSSSLGKCIKDGEYNSGTAYAGRLSSPLDSSAQGSPRSSSIFDSAPAAAVISSAPSSGMDLLSKPVTTDSSGSPSKSASVSGGFEASQPRHYSHIHSSSIQTDNILSHTPPSGVVDIHTQAFDYTEPRALYDDESPTMLSTYDEPIRRIVEDMREQRMSLCQSLRQYVFVHRAIIEGALMIVDEERERNRRLKKEMAVDLGADMEDVDWSRAPEFDEASAGESSDCMSSSSLPPLSTRSGKRNASPTELVKMNTSGDPVLSKRPSIKRKQRSEESSPSFRPHPPPHSHSS